MEEKTFHYLVNHVGRSTIQLLSMISWKLAWKTLPMLLGERNAARSAVRKQRSNFTECTNKQSHMVDKRKQVVKSTQ